MVLLILVASFGFIVVDLMLPRPKGPFGWFCRARLSLAKTLMVPGSTLVVHGLAETQVKSFGVGRLGKPTRIVNMLLIFLLLILLLMFLFMAKGSNKEAETLVVSAMV